VNFSPVPPSAPVLSSLVSRVFLLSPAKSGGKRAELILNPRAGFDLARRLHRGEAVPVSEIFTFLSGLYFRGKIAYSRTFAHPPRGTPGVFVITTNRGLIPAETPLTLEELRAFSDVDIDHMDARYRAPIERDARKIALKLRDRDDAILLGSIGTKKYVDVLVSVFGARLKFPIDFVGRGDMSRGGLLLRRTVDREELDYAPVSNSIRHGKRPRRLEPRSWARTPFAFTSPETGRRFSVPLGERGKKSSNM
jgi:hypothetical protein